MRPLFIINETSRAANYGIGTYVSQLLNAVKDLPYIVHVIHLRDSGVEYPSFEEKDGVKYIRIPSQKLYDKGQNQQQRYLRNVLFLLKPYIDKYPEEEIMFHFNFFKAHSLAQSLREQFRCKVFLTVHYMSWSFELLGDTSKLKSAMENPQTTHDEQIRESVESEKKFINECCDKVIAIAHHSYATLRDVYSIPEAKISLIYNGLDDIYPQFSNSKGGKSRSELRKKYHFDNSEKIIIFAGRLDPVKGLSLLITAFGELMESDSSIRLVVAGDGDMNQYFKEVAPFWTRVTFTGFIDKEHLYNLYYIADIGVLPSLHEEFGYVALEMMMMGLPLVVSRSTGLAELVVDGYNGFTTSLINNDLDQSTTAPELKQTISSLLYNKDLLLSFSINTRKRFLENYKKSLFSQKLAQFYQTEK